VLQHLPPAFDCPATIKSPIASGGDAEQFFNEFALSPDVISTDASNLSLPDRRHRLKTRRRSSGRPEPAKPEPWAGQAFYPPVILLDDVVQVLDLTQSGATPHLAVVFHFRGGGGWRV
jgi:hypothetical protein